MTAVPYVLGNAKLSNGSLAVLAGNTVKVVTGPGSTSYPFNQLQVVVIANTTPVTLNQTTGLSFGTGESPNLRGTNPDVGGGTIAPISGGGMAVLTWGNTNNNYYLELLDNSGSVTKSWFSVAGGTDGNNLTGWIGSWSGGLVVAYCENDASNWYFQRYNNSGTAVGSTIQINPGTYTWNSATQHYSVGTMAVDSLGNVVFSAAPTDVYHYSKYIEYNSINTLVASGTTEQIDAAQQWVPMSGGGFETAAYAPSVAWNPAIGFTEYNLYIETLSATGTLSTVKSVSNYYSTPAGSGGASASNLGIDGNGNFFFDPASDTTGTNFSELAFGTTTITSGYAPSASLSFSTVPTSNPASAITGVGVNASDQLVLETLGSVTCFLRGTSIMTTAGEMPVEDLKPGDMLVTRFGPLRPVKWIGRQSFNGRFLGKEKAPVCFRANSLAANVPCRDLYVSPEHSMVIDDRLVMAGLLVNGGTVTQEATTDQVDLSAA